MRLAVLFVASTTMGSTVSLGAQVPVRLDRERPKDALLILPPMPENPVSDSAYSVEVTTLLRERFGHWRTYAARLINPCVATESCDAMVPDSSARKYAEVAGADFYVMGALRRSSAVEADLRVMETGRRGGMWHRTATLVVRAESGTPAERFAQLIGDVLRDTLATAMDAARDARACWTDVVDRNYAAARDHAAGAMRRFPHHPSAATCLTYVFAEAGQPDSVVWALEQVVAGDSMLAHAWERLGGEYLRRGDTAQAVAARRREVAAAPRDVERRLRVVRLLDDLGLTDQAIAVLREGTEQPGSTLELRRLLARMCLQHEEWECAQQVLADLYARDTSLVGDTAFYFQIIGLAQTMAETTLVIEWTEEAVTKVDSVVDAAWRRVERYRQEAIRAEQILNSLRMAYASALRERGDRDSALAVYLGICGTDSADTRPAVAAVRLLVEDRLFPPGGAATPDSAVAEQIDSLLSSIVGRTDDADILQTVALTYFDAGSRLLQNRATPDLAVHWLEEALRFDQDSSLAHRGQAMLALGLFYRVQDVDLQLREQRTCEVLDRERDLIARGWAAVAEAGDELAELVADVTRGLQAYEELIPDISVLLECDARPAARHLS